MNSNLSNRQYDMIIIGGGIGGIISLKYAKDAGLLEYRKGIRSIFINYLNYCSSLVFFNLLNLAHNRRL